jgi:tryptophanyl-tRNA synthetase
LLVPVGEDQAPHVELTREIVRRFNGVFGRVDWDRQRTKAITKLKRDGLTAEAAAKSVDDARAMLESHAQTLHVDRHLSILANVGLRPQDVLREPAYLPTETPRLPGTDGRRMAKSYGNAIWLSDPPDEIRKKVRDMMTDPQRVRRTDPGRPEVCPVFAYHKLFSPPDVIAWADHGCRTAGIGCVDCKRAMADQLLKWIEPIQENRRKYENHPQQVWDILDAGSNQARRAAKKTMARVHNAIFKWDDARKAQGPSVAMAKSNT